MPGVKLPGLTLLPPPCLVQTLGSRNEEAGQQFVLRFSGPDGMPTVDVSLTGMPAEAIGSYTFNVPGGGFAVPADTDGYTVQLTGATDAAGTAYLKSLSTDLVGCCWLLATRLPQDCPCLGCLPACWPVRLGLLACLLRPRLLPFLTFTAP